MPSFEEDWRFVFAKMGKPKAPGGGNDRRSLNAGAMRRAVLQATRRKPNVMVKITGFSKSTGAGLKPHLDYISRNGNNEVFDHTGTSFDDIARRLGLSAREALDQYGRELANPMQREKTRGRPRERTAMHLMLSMPPGTDKPSFELATRAFLRETFQDHDHLFTFHDDKDHFHAHVVVGLQGHDGPWLNPRRHHLQEWREDFAAALERHGIEAQATTPYSRGRPRKDYRNDIRYMDSPDLQRQYDDYQRKGRTRPPKPSTYDAEAEAGAIERRADAWERMARHYQAEGDGEAAAAIRGHLAENFSRHPTRDSDRER